MSEAAPVLTPKFGGEQLALPHPSIAGLVRQLNASSVRWWMPVARRALDARDAGVCLAIEGADAARVGAILKRLRFAPLPESGAEPWRSFISYHRPTAEWVRVRISIDPSDVSALDSRSTPGAHETDGVALLSAFSRRSVGMTVALLGPDGCGKSTLSARLLRSYPFPARALYLGLWQRTGDAERTPPIPGWNLASHLIRVWRQYLAGQYHRARGRLVVYDRYTYDALLPLSEGHTGVARLYAWILGHACPGPDLVIVLDVPGQVAYERKGEKSPEKLESERQILLVLRHQIANFEVVDATTSLETVYAEVVDRIWRRLTERG